MGQATSGLYERSAASCRLEHASLANSEFQVHPRIDVRTSKQAYQV